MVSLYIIELYLIVAMFLFIYIYEVYEYYLNNSLSLVIRFKMNQLMNIINEVYE